MRVYTKDQQDHYIINLEEYGRLRICGRVQLLPASVHHLNGPHWHDIVWVTMRNGAYERPHICTNYSNMQLRHMLAEEFV